MFDEKAERDRCWDILRVVRSGEKSVEEVLVLARAEVRNIMIIQLQFMLKAWEQHPHDDRTEGREWCAEAIRDLLAVWGAK